MEDNKAMPGKAPGSDRPGFYARVPIRRPRAVAYATPAPGGTPGVRIEAMEIFQSVQGNDNSVPMIRWRRSRW